MVVGWAAAAQPATKVTEREPDSAVFGQPLVLAVSGQAGAAAGGSKDDSLFQIPDLREHLDAMKQAGANYIRNTMSDRQDFGFEVYPFKRLESGKYDLNAWNEEYWERFANLLRWTHERDIIVQIEVWDRFDYSTKNWGPHPYNPKNNVNYTFDAIGPGRGIPGSSRRQPATVLLHHARPSATTRCVLKFQVRFVEELLRHALPYPQVLYCIDNETSGEESWAVYWAGFIRQRAEAAGVEVYVTQMWDDWDLKAERHRRTFDHPERFGFADVSQNNHQKGQTHWDNFQWVRARLADAPRPINTVKTYGADTGRYGTDRDGLERWWRHLVGGAAAVRFHRPDSGLGFSAKAEASIRAARKLAEEVDFWTTAPRQELLRERAANEAYLSADPGRVYALYFPDGGSVELDLREREGAFALRWLDVGNGDWAGQGSIPGGDWRPVNAPGAGHWVGLVSQR